MLVVFLKCCYLGFLKIQGPFSSTYLIMIYIYIPCLIIRWRVNIHFFVFSRPYPLIVTPPDCQINPFVAPYGALPSSCVPFSLKQWEIRHKFLNKHAE